MANAVATSASEVKEALRKEGITVTFKELAKVLGMPVNGNTEILGSLDEIKARIVEPEVPSEIEPSVQAAPKARKAPAKRTRKPAVKTQTITTSNRPPRIERTQEGEKAAADLMNLLDSWPVPDTFPTDLVKFRRSGVAMIRGTTVDGEVHECTQSAALASLERRDELSYSIPLFSEKAQRKIVTAISKLDGAPQPGAVDGNGLKIFKSRTAWYYNLLQCGIRIWAGSNNPPGLNLEKFPHRRFQADGVTPIEDIVFRYRPIMLGWVAQVYEAFESKLIDSNLTGTELREFRANWVNQFIKKQETVSIGGAEKSFADFRGGAEEFRMIWTIVQSQVKEKEAELSKKPTSPRHRTRKG